MHNYFITLCTTLLLLISASALPSTISSTRSLTKRATPTVCNGYSELCSRSYGNVTFIGAHDSYGNGSSIMDNQGKGVVQQLEDGVRTLQVQTHSASSGEIHLCHTSCALLDGGSLTSYLTKVKGWLDQNPDEVITLVLVNSDSLAPTVFASAFNSSGVSADVYTPSSATMTVDSWPTLGSLIENGGRMVVFMDYGADYTSVPWIIDEFSNMWEDAYDVIDQDFSCNVNRTSGSPSTTLYMTNHFLDNVGNFFGVTAFLPNKDKLNQTNAESGYGSIGQGVDNCVGLWERAPNHILLDFYDSNGNAPFNVAASLNGVSAPSNTVTPSTISTGSNAQASSAASASVTASSSAATAKTTSVALKSGGGRMMETGMNVLAAAACLILTGWVVGGGSFSL